MAISLFFAEEGIAGPPQPAMSMDPLRITDHAIAAAVYSYWPFVDFQNIFQNITKIRLSNFSFSLYFIPMDHIRLATETLEKAETDLREIAAKAAAGGDYAGLVQIASWGKAIRDMLEKKSMTRDIGANSSSTNGGISTVDRAKNGGTSHKKEKEKDDYPRFYRKGEELIRIAWSRRARSEYQHKTTETILKSVTDILSRLGRKGRIFSTEEALPVRDAHGAEVPAYQAYVCIALLKMTGLIEQHGRQGYSIASPDEFTDAVDAIWRKLPAFK